jgi:hypothetical protein
MTSKEQTGNEPAACEVAPFAQFGKMLSSEQMIRRTGALRDKTGALTVHRTSSSGARG